MYLAVFMMSTEVGMKAPVDFAVAALLPRGMHLIAAETLQDATVRSKWVDHLLSADCGRITGYRVPTTSTHRWSIRVSLTFVLGRPPPP